MPSADIALVMQMGRAREGQLEGRRRRWSRPCAAGRAAPSRRSSPIVSADRPSRDLPSGARAPRLKARSPMSPYRRFALEQSDQFGVLGRICPSCRVARVVCAEREDGVGRVRCRRGRGRRRVDGVAGAAAACGGCRTPGRSERPGEITTSIAAGSEASSIVPHEGENDRSGHWSAEDRLAMVWRAPRLKADARAPTSCSSRRAGYDACPWLTLPMPVRIGPNGCDVTRAKLHDVVGEKSDELCVASATAGTRRLTEAVL